MKLLLAAVAVLIWTTAIPISGVSATADDPPYYRVTMVVLQNGQTVEKTVINGPAEPPPGYERERAPVTRPIPESATGSGTIPGVPAYKWSLGCAATSAAMIAAYYDRSGLSNIYTGPTNGGLMPLDSSGWGTWKDGAGKTYDQCPLTASHQGLDGRSTRGSIDDYWVAYGSTATDPYLTKGWTQHTWGDAIGDYMKTSQSTYYNDDGATAYYTSGTSAPLTCAYMESVGIPDDSTDGRKLFYEARGYKVTDCYNQDTDNNKSGGFTFAQYKAEIDAGRPVMLNLLGHSVVGVGYDDAGSTVYIHDTWDYNTHTMTWGGSYSGMVLQSVSIVNLCSSPANVAGLAVAKLNSTQVKLTWGAVTGADHYEVWSAVNQPYFVPGADCTKPAPYTCTKVTGTSQTVTALGDPTNNRTYAVLAANACGGALGLPLGPSWRV